MDSGPILPISGMGFSPTTGAGGAESVDPLQFFQQLQNFFAPSGGEVASTGSAPTPTRVDPLSELNNLSLFSQIGRSDEFRPGTEATDAPAISAAPVGADFTSW